MVKLLDVFYKRRRTGAQIASDMRSLPGRPADRTEPDLFEPRGRFRCPYARVTQTLPSHESSIGALAVGARTENSCFGGVEQNVVISGGGKMELRAWCLEDQRGIGADVGRTKSAVDATCAPPVSLLRSAASLAQLNVFFFSR